MLPKCSMCPRPAPAPPPHLPESEVLHVRTGSVPRGRCRGRIDPSTTVAERPRLCARCEMINWEKRNQTADLTGKACVVTGGRVNIGFQVALKLLRCGAEATGGGGRGGGMGQDRPTAEDRVVPGKLQSARR